jgi:hypothetical protein
VCVLEEILHDFNHKKSLIEKTTLKIEEQRQRNKKSTTSLHKKEFSFIYIEQELYKQTKDY